MSLAVAELAELMVERARGFLGGAEDRPVNGRAVIRDRHRGYAGDAGFERAPEIRPAAARSVNVGYVNFHVGDPALEAGQPLPNLLLELGIAVGVAGELIVGVDLNEQG